MPPPGDQQPDIVRADGQFDILGERDFFVPVGWDGGDNNIPHGEELSRMWSTNLEVSLSLQALCVFCVKRTNEFSFESQAIPARQQGLFPHDGRGGGNRRPMASERTRRRASSPDFAIQV